MHRTRALRVLQILAGVLILAAPALAGPPGGPPGGRHYRHHGPEDFILRESKRLGLDEKTTQAIQQVVASQREEARGLEEQRDAARRKLGDLLTQEPLDEKAALAQADVVGRIDTELRKQRLETMFKIRALLTPAQRQKLVAQMKDRHHRWRQRREQLETACADDLAKFCAEGPAGRGELGCLRMHREELSKTCQETMTSMREKWGRGPGPGGPGGPGPGGPNDGPPPDLP